MYAAGDDLVTQQVDEARVGLSICYDLRFPELYRGLMVLGAEVLTVPSAFTAVTGEAHWEVLLRPARSRTSASWSRPRSGARGGRPRTAAARTATRWSWTRGDASWPARPGEGDGVWFADLDLTEFRRIRETLPALRHRRLGTTC